MTQAAVQIIIFALAAAASPLALTATYIVLRSRRPRTNGIAFLSGFLVGTTLACIVGLIVGDVVLQRIEAHETLTELLTLALGLLLLWVGLRARHSPLRPESEGGRARAILAGLGEVGPAAAFSMAGLLGFGGPKRLVLTLLAMAGVTQLSLRSFETLTLVLTYIGIATIMVSVPVVAVVIAGDRAEAAIERGRSWVTAHAVSLRVWLAIGLGVGLIADALLKLLS